MKTYKSKSGPFKESIYLSNEDIERTCIDELQALGLLPAQPQPIRIDRFVEKRFVTPNYEDLGEGILGFTKFGKSGVEEIIINRRLEDENTKVSERRIRTTLAHEAGHGLFHTHLFVLGGSQSKLFGDQISEPKILCREDSQQHTTSYKGNWWEVQANKAIGPLLLPKHLVITALEPFMTVTGSLGIKYFDFSKLEDAAKQLADTFDVNPVVAKIRISGMFSQNAQGVL